MSNEIGRDTGQSERLRTITPHRRFLSTLAALAGRKVESLADLLREFNSFPSSVCSMAGGAHQQRSHGSPLLGA